MCVKAHTSRCGVRPAGVTSTPTVDDGDTGRQPTVGADHSLTVYCEGQFGDQDGKTANGLVRHSERYEILSVDAGRFLDGTANGIPVLASLVESVAAAVSAGVTITDVRRPKARRDLHLISGRIVDVTCPRIAVLGTDGAIGKRTTATLLVQALNARGIRAVMVGTGQTTLIQGGKYGDALDAPVPQFCSGEVEHQIVAAPRPRTTTG